LTFIFSRKYRRKPA